MKFKQIILIGTLGSNVTTIFLTYLVVFVWKIGYELNPVSNIRLETEGLFLTLIFSQLALTGTFLLLRWGFARFRPPEILSKIGFLAVFLVCFADLLNDLIGLVLYFH